MVVSIIFLYRCLYFTCLKFARERSDRHTLQYLRTFGVSSVLLFTACFLEIGGEILLIFQNIGRLAGNVQATDHAKWERATTGIFLCMPK